MRGFGAVPGGGVKNAVVPTTRSHAPIRHNQSAASAERHTIRLGAVIMFGSECPLLAASIRTMTAPAPAAMTPSQMVCCRKHNKTSLIGIIIAGTNWFLAAVGLLATECPHARPADTGAVPQIQR